MQVRASHPARRARLDALGRREEHVPPVREEVSTMCYERYLRRRQEDEESNAIWQDFERTRPISDPEPREVDEPEPAEPERGEDLTASER
jgi:hypothetical protein